jgi:hypothetical protein
MRVLLSSPKGQGAIPIGSLRAPRSSGRCEPSAPPDRHAIPTRAPRHRGTVDHCPVPLPDRLEMCRLGMCLSTVGDVPVQFATEGCSRLVRELCRPLPTWCRPTVGDVPVQDRDGIGMGSVCACPDRHVPVQAAAAGCGRLVRELCQLLPTSCRLRDVPVQSDLWPNLALPT